MGVKTFISIGLMLLVMLCAAPVYANGIPTLPHAFYGSVTINGDPAPDGTQISATVAEGEVLTTSQNPIATVNGNYGIDGLHLLVQGYGLSGAITFYVNGVEVEGATATFEAGGGPTLRDLDLVSDITAQKVVTVPAGETDYVIDFSAEAGTTITVDTIGEVTVTVQKYAENPHPEVALPASMLPTYIDISVDNPDAVDWPMHVEYTYTDAEVAGLDESTLVMHYFKAAAWHECSDTGVNTATNTIWANMTRDELSGSPVAFGGAVAQEPEPAPTPGEGGGGAPLPPPPLAPPLPPGTIDVSGFVSAAGTFTETVVIESVDGKCWLTINEGTIGLSEDGDPLAEIAVTEMEDPPAPPENSHIIGLAYDLGPDGATFNPPMALTITYDASLIPEGIAEENLVIAMWDEDAGEWVELPSTVDTVNHTITASVSHFTTFAIIAREVPPPEPATFSLSNLSIWPAEVQPEEAVTINVLVANTGGMEGSYTVVLMINDVKEAEESVTIAAGDSHSVSFSITKEDAGSYSVAVGELSDSFTVVTPPTVKPQNWLLLGGIIVGTIVVELLIFFAVRRRAY